MGSDIDPIVAAALHAAANSSRPSAWDTLVNYGKMTVSAIGVPALSGVTFCIYNNFINTNTVLSVSQDPAFIIGAAGTSLFAAIGTGTAGETNSFRRAFQGGLVGAFVFATSYYALPFVGVHPHVPGASTEPIVNHAADAVEALSAGLVTLVDPIKNDARVKAAKECAIKLTAPVIARIDEAKRNLKTCKEANTASKKSQNNNAKNLMNESSVSASRPSRGYNSVGWRYQA